MKPLVVCLVLANVCYFLWEHGIAKAPESVAAPAAPPGTLKLASEASERARTESTAAASAPIAAGAPGPPEGARDGGNSGLLSNVKRCISVGPFRDVSEAAHSGSTLRADVYDPRHRVAQRHAAHG